MKYSNEMHMQKIRGKICKKSLMTTYLYVMNPNPLKTTLFSFSLFSPNAQDYSSSIEKIWPLQLRFL